MANFIKVATLCAAESEGLLDAPGRVSGFISVMVLRILDVYL